MLCFDVCSLRSFSLWTILITHYSQTHYTTCEYWSELTVVSRPIHLHSVPIQYETIEPTDCYLLTEVINSQKAELVRWCWVCILWFSVRCSLAVYSDRPRGSIVLKKSSKIKRALYTSTQQVCEYVCDLCICIILHRENFLELEWLSDDSNCTVFCVSLDRSVSWCAPSVRLFISIVCSVPCSILFSAILHSGTH